MTERSTPETVVGFDRVALQFGEKAVLRDISFVLERGETKMVLGAAGSGKSVLLKLSMGLLKPDSGRITVLGVPITEQSEEELFRVRQRLGMVFQESALFDSLTVGENVGDVFERLPEVSPEEKERRGREALRLVEGGDTLGLYL